MNIEQLTQWFENVFKQTKLFTDMKSTVENSPWHREANVAVHTEMVFEQYIKSLPENPSKEDVLGAFAVIFHDVGKPSSMEIKHSETRGEYRSFAAHEQKSARLFENYAVKHLTNTLTPEEIYTIGWMIEYHLPWSITNPSKRRMLMLTAIARNIVDVFVRVLMADQKGRIGDDPSKVDTAQLWCDQFVSLCHEAKQSAVYDNKDATKVLYMPIGPSGAGKTTTYNVIKNALVEKGGALDSYSLDTLRHEWYGEDYALAWEASVNDAQFSSKALARFNSMLNSSTHLYVDNTNLSKKSRRQYIDAAQKKGYAVHAIYIPCDISTVLNRQTTRTDKTVPDSAVLRQYFSLQLPSYGEFDNVIVSGNNFNVT